MKRLLPLFALIIYPYIMFSQVLENTALTRASDTALRGFEDPEFVDSEWLTIDKGGSMSLLGDYDQDEDLDLLLTYTTGSELRTRLFRFTGDSYEDSGVEFSEIALDGRWIDYNNDGFIDLLLYSGYNHDPVFTLYKNENGNGFSEQSDKLSFPNIQIQSGMSLGDYDSDGDEDMAIQTLSPDYTKASIHIYENDGEGKFTRNSDIELEGHLKSDYAWADYDKDGDLDLLANRQFPCVVTIFENKSDKKFVPMQLELDGLEADFLNFVGDMKWGDYDSDGYPDILVSGRNACQVDYGLTHIYHNNGDKTFSQIAELVDVREGVTVDWGDYDNDGDLDAFVFGDRSTSPRTRIYRNEAGAFEETSIDYLLDGRDIGTAVRGDIDNDGDLDYVIVGQIDIQHLPKIIVYRNMYSESFGITNHKPSVPNGLESIVSDDGFVTLSWNKSQDNETDQDGLTYNMYIIDEAGSFVVNSYSMANGSRMIPSPGNVSGTGIKLKLKPGLYRWSVQSVDNGFEGSEFSEEDSFFVGGITGIESEEPSIIRIFPNPANNYLNLSLTSLQFPLDLRVTNSMGQIISEVAVNTPESVHNISDLATGVYLISIYHNGVKVGKERLFKR